MKFSQAPIVFSASGASLLFAYLLTGSLLLALPYGFFGAGIPFYLWRKKQEKFAKKIEGAWSETLDLIISGVLSGLSLPATLSSLKDRGPMEVRPFYQEFYEGLNSGKTFSQALIKLRTHFSDSLSDQIFEILDFARESGARDTALTLRALSDHARADLQLRAEIAAKQSWIKNSGVLAAAAPWLLLLLLSRSPNSISAFQSRGGVVVLLVGVVMTVIAYLWISFQGRAPQPVRIFQRKYESFRK
jgi:tight adherence protein B